MGQSSAAEVRVGVNSGLGLACQVGGVRAGLQADRVGAFVQAGYCSSNIQNVAGGVSLGGGVTFDVYQSPELGAYLLAGVSTNPNTNIAAFGGAGLRYGIPLIPIEGYIEAAVQGTSSVLGPVVGPRVTVGVNYVVRGVVLSAASPSSSSDGSSGSSIPASCNITPDQDRSNAASTAESSMRSAIQAGASAYSGFYQNINYSLSVGSVSVSGDSASVSGSVSFTATQVSDGRQVSDSYSGTVSLSRSGCGWSANGFSRS